MLVVLKGAPEICLELGARAQALRVNARLTQSELAKRAGLALSTLRLFEQTGQISLERLVRIAIALGALDSFEALLQPPAVRSLEELEARSRHRKRGARKS